MYEWNEEGMKVGGTFTRSERLGRPTLKELGIGVEGVIRIKSYLAILEWVIEIEIKGLIIMEEARYPISLEHSIKDLAWVLIRWYITWKIEILFSSLFNLLKIFKNRKTIRFLIFLSKISF